MRIAISGASGLVGSALTRRLSAAGHQIVRLTRSVSQKSPSRPSDIEWSPATGLATPTLLNGCDALVHLAGRSIGGRRWSAGEKQLIRDSRVRATEMLSAQVAKLEAPPPLIISASAIGVYGNCGANIIDESAASASDFLGELASDWEGACEPLLEAGLRVVHPRLGIVLSEQGGALGKMLPLFRWGLGGKLGSGQQYWSWIGIEDCVAALIWLLTQSEARGSYNLVAPNAVTNREFTQALAGQLSRPAWLPVPSFALRLALGEMADALLLCSCRAVPSRLDAGGFAFQYTDLDGCLASILGGPSAGS